MKIIVFGVGRSGTTALYRLMQHILEERTPGGVDYVYEPFLWDREVFNGQLPDVMSAFSLARSLSIDGMYEHKKLPLFIRAASHYPDNAFVSSLLEPAKPGDTLLVKFIRGNGRYRLLRALSSDAKFVFVLRNPADVVNSVIDRFSFLGDDFYASDYPRFAAEVRDIFGSTLPDPRNLAEQQVLYWYYMNRFALESFAEGTAQPLVVCYENLIADRATEIERICNHCEIPYKPEFGGLLQAPVGPVTSGVKLLQEEYSAVLPYLDDYAQLLRDHALEHAWDIENTKAKYEGQLRSETRRNECFGFTALATRHYYQRRQRASEERVEADIKAGEQAFAAEDYAQATALFAHALSLAPSNPTAHSNLGVVHFANGLIGPALEHLRAAYQEAPHDEAVITNLIEVLRAVGQDELADTVLREFAANAPSAPVHVFHHMPKCAGTSVRRVLANWFTVVEDYRGGWDGDQPDPVNLADLTSIHCLCGHFVPSLPERYPEISKAERFRVFTFLRDPLQCALSLRRYELANRPGAGEDDQVLDIEKFLFRGENPMAKLLGATFDTYEAVLDQYIFVGIFEELQESMNRLADLLGKPTAVLPRLNVTQEFEDSSEAQALPTDILAKFREQNALDYLLYEHSLSNFKENMRSSIM